MRRKVAFPDHVVLRRTAALSIVFEISFLFFAFPVALLGNPTLTTNTVFQNAILWVLFQKKQNAVRWVLFQIAPHWIVLRKAINFVSHKTSAVLSILFQNTCHCVLL
jgi:hypothetical protein